MKLLTFKASLLGLAVFSLAIPAVAGTYTVVSVDWYPSTTPGAATNGYISFGGGSTNDSNVLDVCYGMSGSASAPVPSNNATGSASVLGTWKWKVRWVGDLNETHPDAVSATIEIKGGAAADADCSVEEPSGSATAHGLVSDSNLLSPVAGTIQAAASATTPGNFQDTDTVPYSGSNEVTAGTGEFTQVPGSTNTWEAYVDWQVNAQVTASASGLATGTPPFYAVESGGEGSGTENAIVRLTKIAGNRVQDDISQNPTAGGSGGGGGGTPPGPPPMFAAIHAALTSRRGGLLDVA